MIYHALVAHFDRPMERGDTRQLSGHGEFPLAADRVPVTSVAGAIGRVLSLERRGQDLYATCEIEAAELIAGRYPQLEMSHVGYAHVDDDVVVNYGVVRGIFAGTSPAWPDVTFGDPVA